ncbi:Predicted metal-binding integral membrane protein [Sphingomonas sp. NFR04]|uniref:copper chaperone n=1 Tax=Sphingomonas sp. NFR04 TaxID=1566283 RepID=UPI0008E12B67|nr:DUF2182 domain-containing protein [Sphingomonas sp. NFR04]SFJ16261.1 Predicted metal-binding integral membrane protein [Sphingomonas sp. NFR04]
MTLSALAPHRISVRRGGTKWTPAWYLVVASLGAWAALPFAPMWMAHSRFCGPEGLWLAPTSRSIQLALAPARPATWCFSWALMTLAMMAPMLLPPLRAMSAAGRVGWGGTRATLFVATYIACWAIVGIPLTLVAVLLRLSLPAPWPLALVCATALAWEISPAKQFRSRFRPKTLEGPLAAAADGLRYAIGCVISCWALMLLPLLADGAHIGVMAAVTIWLAAAPHAAAVARRLLAWPIGDAAMAEMPRPSALRRPETHHASRKGAIDAASE